MINKSAYERAIERYEPDTNGGCWLWTAGLDKSGYAVISENNRQTKVHRLIYKTLCGSIPNGLLVCHRCDVRSCINPEHLFLGTHADNTNDMYAKGRGVDRKGIKHPLAKLSSENVLEIRNMVRAGNSQSSVAKKFSVSKSTISGICSQGRWNHVE